MPDDPRTPDDRIPVTVVTGYLGAGKTTLVNTILAGLSGRKYAVIVNEFGDIGIDGDLIEAGREELIELSSGCICCVIRGDLVRTLRQLISDRPEIEGIIIETTGLANPSPVIQTMVVDQVIGAQCRLDSVVAVVDAANILDQLAAHSDAADQIAFSDFVLLNKISDRRTPLADIEARVREINPFAEIAATDRARIPAEKILDRGSFDLSRVEARFDRITEDGSGEDYSHHDHIADDGISSFSLSSDEPVDAERLEVWLQDLLSKHGNDILRTKGVLWAEDAPRKLVLQAVNMMLEGRFGGLWGKETRRSRLVFIGRRLDRTALRNGFENCRVRHNA